MGLLKNLSLWNRFLPTLSEGLFLHPGEGGIVS